MGRIPWDTQEPGHFETDLVHHGGERSAGEYGYTLQLIDVADFLERTGSNLGARANGYGNRLPSRPGAGALCGARTAS